MLATATAHMNECRQIACACAPMMWFFVFIGIYAYALYVYAADGADNAEHVMTIATVTATIILTALSRMSVRGVLERMF